VSRRKPFSPIASCLDGTYVVFFVITTELTADAKKKAFSLARRGDSRNGSLHFTKSRVVPIIGQ